VNTLYCLEEWSGEQRISPPRGLLQSSLLGDNFAPRSEVKNGPQDCGAITTYNVAGSNTFSGAAILFYVKNLILKKPYLDNNVSDLFTLSRLTVLLQSRYV
jgi:hypothetical protein